MRKFIAGVILGVGGLAAVGFVYMHYGFVNLTADQPVSRMERAVMGGGMDRYAERYASKVTDPVEPNDINLIEGIRLYRANCAMCHGDFGKPVSELGRGFYPRTPQFLSDAPDMPPEQNFWIIKHGVRWTGMPAWGKLMPDSDIWKITTFLGKMDELDKFSPAVQDAWKNPGTKP
jgi:mono/diheme cytochrome c family protein